MKAISVKCLVATVVFQLVAWAASEARAPDVPYVSTPQKVVAKMLDMAQVGPYDVLYDLGCGDGRIVITAAKERGTRGVGIDISPTRIKESRSNAEQAKVSGRVQFLEQDLFTSDFSEASVVTLYLLPKINLGLRPRLLRELKPGTRIVSHAFSMGDWKADQIESVEGNKIYYWVVPANVTGTWEWRAAEPEGIGHFRLELKQVFQEVEGTLETGSLSIPIGNATLAGARLEFTVAQNGPGVSSLVRYEVRVQENTMAGRRFTDDTGKPGLTPWQAKRNPATIRPLDHVETVQQADVR